MRRVYLRQHWNAAAADTIYKSLVKSVPTCGEAKLGVHSNDFCLLCRVPSFDGTRQFSVEPKPLFVFEPIDNPTSGTSTVRVHTVILQIFKELFA